jgi:hypothetical protein
VAYTAGWVGGKLKDPSASATDRNEWADKWIAEYEDEEGPFTPTDYNRLVLAFVSGWVVGADGVRARN